MDKEEVNSLKESIELNTFPYKTIGNPCQKAISVDILYRLLDNLIVKE